MSIETVSVAPAQLVAEVTKLKADGYRLVTMSSVETGAEDMEILYHFDKDLKLVNLRLSLKKGGSVPSISGVLFTAFLVENEIRDQFGVSFEGLVLDYQGRLLNDCSMTPQSSPFCRLLVKSSGTVAKEVR